MCLTSLDDKNPYLPSIPKVEPVHGKSLSLGKDFVAFMFWSNRDTDESGRERKRHAPNCRHRANVFLKPRCYDDRNLWVKQSVNLVRVNLIPRQRES